MPLERLSAQDARLLSLEGSTIAGHTCKVVIAERPRRDGDLVDALRASVAARAERTPRARQRLVPTPLGLAPPAWADDPDFDVARHVAAVPAAGPVDDARLRELIAERFAVRLPRDRPLWRIDVIEELEGGRVAYLVFSHHALADGTAALRLGAALVWDEEPDPRAPAPAAWRAMPAPGRTTLLAAGAAERACGAGHAIRALARDVRSPGRLRRPSPRVLVRALRRESGDSPLDVPIGAHRRVAFVPA